MSKKFKKILKGWIYDCDCKTINFKGSLSEHKGIGIFKKKAGSSKIKVKVTIEEIK